MATEFNQVSQELANDMELLRSGVQGTTKAFDKAGADIAKSSKELLKGLGAATLEFGKDLYDGSEGFSAYNNSIKAGTKAFSGLLAQIPIVGKALGFFAETMVGVATRAVEDFDKVFETYRDLSRIGATGAEGMMGFAESATRAGYTLKNIGDFTSLMSKNSQTMALFGQGVLDGMNKMAGISEAITDSGLRRELFAMGFKVNDINEGIVRYARVQTITGQQARMTQEQLTKGAGAYIKELDFLTKLTGKNAEQQQTEYEARMLDERLLASRLASEAEEKRLRDAGLTAQADQIKAQREAKERLLTIVPASLQKDLGALFEGILTGPEVARLYQMMPETARYVAQGGRDLRQFSALMRDELDAFTGPEGLGSSQARLGNFNSSFGNFSEIIKAREAARVVAETGSIEAALKNQTVTDTATKTQAEIRDLQIKGAASLQKFIRDGVDEATKALIKLREEIYKTPTKPGAAGGAPSAGRTEVQRSRGFLGELFPSLESNYNRQVESRRPGAAAPAPAPGGGTETDPLASLNFGGARGERTGGGAASPRLVELAKKIQETFPDAVFTAMNDVYHQKYKPNSAHVKGRALDFALGERAPRNATEAAEIKNFLQELGFVNVRDEYFADKSDGTGPHFHAEVSAKFGRYTSGPLSGYRATLHGNEVVIPLSNGQSIPLDMSPLINNLDQSVQVMQVQISKLDELITLSRDQLAVNRKILNQRS